MKRTIALLIATSLLLASTAFARSQPKDTEWLEAGNNNWIGIAKSWVPGYKILVDEAELEKEWRKRPEGVTRVGYVGSAANVLEEEFGTIAKPMADMNVRANITPTWKTFSNAFFRMLDGASTQDLYKYIAALAETEEKCINKWFTDRHQPPQPEDHEGAAFVATDLASGSGGFSVAQFAAGTFWESRSCGGLGDVHREVFKSLLQAKPGQALRHLRTIDDAKVSKMRGVAKAALDKYSGSNR